MGQHVCLICGETHDSGEILLDKRLKNSLERTTVTGHGNCSTCDERIADGMVAMIGADESKSKKLRNGNLDPTEAYRTGELIWLKDTVFAQVFDVPVPPQSICFVEGEVIKMLTEKLQHSQSTG